MARIKLHNSTHGNFHSFAISCRSKHQLELIRRAVKKLKARYKAQSMSDALQRYLGA